MSKLISELREEMIDFHGTRGNSFEDFPVGTHVEVITPCCDFNFFYNERGTVIQNSGEYLGIIVKFDKPREFEDGSVQIDFNFNPPHLKIIRNLDRFSLMDLS